MNKKISFKHMNQKNNSFYLPKDLAHGEIKHIDIQEGLSIFKIDLKVKENFILENTFEEKMLSFSSFLKGDLHYTNKDFNIDKKLKTNYLDICALNCENGLSYYKKGSHIKALTIVTSENFIKDNLLNNQENSEMHNILDKLNKQEHFEFIDNSSCSYETINTLGKIYNTNINEKFHKLSLKSNTYDFLFNCFTNLDKSKISSLKDIDKLYLLKTKDYIISNLHEEFTLKKLARISSSNETKLQKNFKIFFNMTVFKFILEQRMNKAKHLLHNTDYSINEVSLLVGYKYQSNFSIAFYKRFNILAKDVKNYKENLY